MKKYIHKIIFENQSKEVEIVEKYKQKILQKVQSLMDSSFDFDMILHIWICDTWECKNYLEDEVEDAFSAKKGKKYIICLKTEVIKSIEYDHCLNLDRAIFHEMAHIYDMYHILNNKYHKFNPTKRTQRTKTDYICSLGWRFWTEFFAYYHTFKNFYEYTNFPTFLSLVKGYERLKKDSEKIKNLYIKNAPERNDKALEFLEKIDVFVYALAKFLSGQIAGKTKHIKYCQKTEERESFKYVEKLCDGFMKHIVQLFTNTHRKGMTKKLYNLGVFIFKKIHIKLSMGVGIVKGEAVEFIWIDD